ncbi:tubulin polyglutamylase TTLL5 [Rana temporaria]|uniref:tubulin polyglutamylase TTLL5 n=1 Tax=Rana temporaria TaxID=8407 RepID=UPI001AAC6EDF|nr:tubulin polyglutamylase TTLL5 [Rana temporaria]
MTHGGAVVVVTEKRKEMPSRLCREEEEAGGKSPRILWTGTSRRVPVIVFHPEAILTKEPSWRTVGERYHLAFKMVRTDSRLVRNILSSHGFQEANANSNDFNLMWTGSHIKPHLLRNLTSFQRVNHFPRSYELTRKDRLYKNVQRMQQTHGVCNFSLLPQTYLLPGEYQDFCNAYSKDRGPWIVKPVASSRGRGVYLVNSPSQISLEDNILVSRYVSNPLLIDGFKFDVRLYVLITSYDPLVIYLYEEGLTRFATVRYDRTAKNIKNQFMHLTNYSVNKKSGDYVSCDDPEVEDYGNKWSMSAMLRYLKQEGKDTAGLMSQVEDLIIKTIISGELPIASACKSLLANRGNCFELYGFDVLIDSNMKPWLLEVNLSPSLACDAPLDLKVKASMISDMLTLVGLECQDPLQRPVRGGVMLHDKRVPIPKAKRQRPLSASDIETGLQAGSRDKSGNRTSSTLGLSTEEVKILHRVQEEESRRGSYVRIFPRHDTWSLYGSFLEHKTSMNYMLANHLFPDRMVINHKCDTRPKLHAALYERKLLSLQMRKARKHGLVRRAGLSHPPEGFTTEQEEEDEAEEEEVDEITDPPSPEPQTVPPPPSPPPPPPLVSILGILQRGENLSKVQARWAFCTYLQRVQSRLQRQQDSEKPLLKEEEQMELVLRFLQRAASNLQRSVSVTLPGRSVPIQERRQLLANQLGDFITLYDEETREMSTPDSSDGAGKGVDPEDFQAFISEASECDLEEVLTFYTHKNKSASVFLGGSSSVLKGGKQSADCPLQLIVPFANYLIHILSVLPIVPSTHSPSITCPVFSSNMSSFAGTLDGVMDKRPESGSLNLQQQAGSPSRNDPAKSRLSETADISAASLSVTSVLSDGSATSLVRSPSHQHRSCPPSSGIRLNTSSNSAHSTSTGIGVQPVPRSQNCTLGAFSSFQSAAQIYSQRLIRPSSSRPAGAQTSAQRIRCNSAGSLKGLEDPYNVGAVTASLQRLAEKQACRNNLTQLRYFTQQLTNLNIASRAVVGGGIRLGSALRSLSGTGNHTAAEHSNHGARDGTQRVQLAWDAEVETNTCPHLPGTNHRPPSGRSQSGEKSPGQHSGHLQPAPPSSHKTYVARKLSASRIVRVSVSEGQNMAGPVLSAETRTQGKGSISLSDPDYSTTGNLTGLSLPGASEPPQVIFARSKPPVAPARTSGRAQRRRDPAVCPT